MSWITCVYECCLCMGLTWSNLKPACIICTVCEQPAVDGRFIAAVTNKKCVLQLEASPLRLPMLHSGSSPALPIHLLRLPILSARGRSIFRKYLCTFKIYGIWPQADRHAYASCNAVPLVWGSLRLPPAHWLYFDASRQSNILPAWT